MNTPLFLFNLGLTVGLVGLSVWTGRRGIRRWHYLTVAVTVVSLVLAIIQAELYGRDFHFVSWKLNVHLTFATSCLASLPLVAWSGLRLRNHPVMRPVHKRWIGLFLVLLVMTVLTACYMFLDASPRTAS